MPAPLSIKVKMALSTASVACPGSPDITTLSYSALFDISGAVPTIVLTNNSTVVHANNLKWWYVITTPSGTVIHQGSLTSPDVANTPWTTLQIPANSWPLLFGSGLCAQVEFSSNVPYVCTLYVQDSALNQFSLPITQTIVRPNGNTSDSCGNFGVANVNVSINCSTSNAFCTDNTNFTYNNIISPAIQSNTWTLVYPPDANGNQPANGTAPTTPYVNFKLGYGGDGYVLYLQDYATYDMGNGAAVKVQYKAINPKTGSPGIPFAVLCNINFCQLQCQIQKFYELSKSKCGVLEDPALDGTMARMNLLLWQATIGVVQPLCGIDSVRLVEEVKRLGKLEDNCDCGCTDTGSNFSYPIGGPGGSGSPGGCCPVSSNVVIRGTNNAPAPCPQSYFPATVYDPTGVTIIGNANNVSDLVAILNAYPAWQAYGVAFAEGNCKIGWVPATGAGVIPNTQVVLGSNNTNGTTTITTKLVTLGTTNPPPGCPTGNPYPVKVYDPTGTSVIGIANSINDVVSIVNANAAWQVYGIASVGDNCSISWQAPNTTSTVTIPNTQVTSDTTSTTCVNGANIYTLSVTDVCLGTSVLASTSFPLNAYVDFGLGAGKVSLGNIVSWPALIAAYNTTPTKPAGITFSAGTVVGQVVVTNSNCTAYNGPLTLTADLGSEDFILYGGNHNQMIQSPPSFAAEEGFGLATGTLLGKIPGGPASNMRIWHTVTVGNYLLHSVTTLNAIGQVYVYDITNTLMPMLLWTIVLPDTGSGTCFTGVPYTNTIASSGPVPSLYGLYFPTDNPSAMFPTSVTVWESITGSGWKLDITTGTVVANYADQRLRNKCPRLILGTNILHTWDGDMGVTGGLSSGILSGQAVISNTSSFSSGTLAVQDVLNKYAPTTEYLWAATVDGAGTIWYVGSAGTLATAPGILGAVTFYANAFPVPSSRLNIKIFGGTIYASALAFAGKTTGTILLVTGSLPTITTLAFQNFTPPGSVVANNASHYNVLPLGNCIVAVTYDNHADTAHPQGGVALFKTDGSFIECIPVTGGDVYNVVAIGISGGVYVPNNLV